MKLYLFLIALSPQFWGASPTVAQSLEALFVQDKKIAYKGYLITGSASSLTVRDIQSVMTDRRS